MNRKLKKSPVLLLTLFLISLLFIVQQFVGTGITLGDSDSTFNKQIKGVKKTSEGEVIVYLTPIKFKKGELQVRIAIDTHNVDDLYKYNLKKIVTLDAGQNTVAPSSVPRLGGHHNNGKLVFKLDKLPNQLMIRITDLHDKGVREFIWP